MSSDTMRSVCSAMRVGITNGGAAVTSPIRIAIVGGVAGGASAATRARRVNEAAEITLFERDRDVSFANCGLPYYIGGEIEDRRKLLVATAPLLRERFNIDVRTRHAVMRIDRSAKAVEVYDELSGERYAHPYDKLILSPGAVPFVPPVPGLEGANVFTLRGLDDADRIRTWMDACSPSRAVVLGAGFIGLEMVEQLVRRNLAVSLVEKMPQVLPVLDAEVARGLESELERHHVALRLNCEVRRAGRKGAGVEWIELSTGEVLHAEMFVVGVGVRPNVQLAVEAGLALGKSGGVLTDPFMRTSDPDIYAVGDAAEYPYGPTGGNLRVPLAGPANRAGRLAGEHAATGQSAPMGAVFGTAIVRVFELTAGIAGLSEKQALRLDQHAKSVIVRANHHASYYPGAQQLTLKLVYAARDGTILGVQALGAEGVDKRLDVVATAMHFGGTVADLAQLDLAYAPPFGAAKDPVHIAAFAASNDLAGLVRYLPPDADLSGVRTIDVRTPEEASAQPVDHARQLLNIPLDELRGRLDELDPRVPTAVVCASGQRSYVGARMLSQHGFDSVSTLNGGQRMRRLALHERQSLESSTNEHPQGPIHQPELAR